ARLPDGDGGRARGRRQRRRLRLRLLDRQRRRSPRRIHLARHRRQGRLRPHPGSAVRPIMRTLLFTALLMMATPAAGADIVRSGGYFGLGVGVGSSSLAKQSFLGSGAAQFSLRGGVIVARRLLLGPEVTLTGQYNGWNPNTPTGAGLSSVMAEAMVF